ncbi:MAG: hypothetical protein HY908_18680 [Myxococcales bacterium]|nr:hypothetical protein [Myxococcales bacterium]
MTEPRRFRVRRKGASEPLGGTFADWEIRTRVLGGLLAPEDLAGPVGTRIWAPIGAWQSIGVDAPPPPRHAPVAPLSAEVPAGAPGLRFVLKSGDRIEGPMGREELIDLVDTGDVVAPVAALPGGDSWFPVEELASAREAVPTPPPLVNCETCLEVIPYESHACPHCGEDPRGPLSSARPGTLPEPEPDPGFLRLHWRPMVTLTVLGTIIGLGIVLRHLAPNRFTPPAPHEEAAAAAAAVCDTPCWNGEACELGHCVWQSPNDVGHPSRSLTVAGPFSMPKDVTDVLPLDGERLLASTLVGVQVLSARTGELLEVVNEAPQAQRLYRVDDVVYVTSPQRIYVLDVAGTRLLKTIEIGSRVHSIELGAGGRQALASIPGARAVAVISTDFHAEIDRFYFGDDAVGPMGLDDGGRVAIVTTGELPLPGFRGNTGGALYAFDPTALASRQDIVRAAMEGNPVDVMTTPDGETSYVVLREKNQVVELRRTPSGAVRRAGEMPTCQQPEQMALVRRGRRAVVRCNMGRELSVFDLERRTLLEHVALNGRASDMVVTPDALEALVVMPRNEDGGAVGVLDLETLELRVTELATEPSRVRLSADGRTAAVISDRSKVAWVIR